MTTATQPALVAGEMVRYQGQFSPHLFLSHVKTTVTLTDRRVIVHHPHLLFGIFQRGYLQHEAPLRHVCQVSTGNATSTRKILYGVFLLFAALLCFTSSGQFLNLSAIPILLGVIFLAMALIMFISATATGVFFRSTGGALMIAEGARSELAEIQRAGYEIGRLIFT